ncbi:kinesin-like protein Klp8 [Schizosaccharomyces cryophilus OY26]|uniref:Kinesin-like protein Klp8 n=1 Tax=Schizosaccharomyces cryophilus (strain OY26 / ATCC MYA-4695 / CBS 11777 / NBRC 106824 / NRRL Y48691) TaxID=653667 RepID=S9X904_SCHCR|nr:kinesin-like protein Klp8 [Schizosaccharomyces cryophilus OY26]EPY50306.1 kinesin-like protein Klp8 [Schizosaccharomyces cryophilus OY26]
MSTANVRTIVRVRPKSLRELSTNAVDLLTVDEEKKEIIIQPPPEGLENSRHRHRVRGPRVFHLDECFVPSVFGSNGQASEEEAIFQRIGPYLIHSALEGYNTCLFTYGQSGSGKTYSTIGVRGQAGLIPRLSTFLFNEIERIEEETNAVIRVSISVVEVLNETVYDLLESKESKENDIRIDASTHNFSQGFSQFEVENAQEIDAFLRLAVKTRKTTIADQYGKSYGHTAIIFKVHQKIPKTDKQGSMQKDSYLKILDLGSFDRSSNRKSGKDTPSESAANNNSLSVLNRVIASLTSKKNDLMIPYNDSLLTRLLRDALGGNCRTVMLACVSPCDFDDTFSTLRYAEAARKIKNISILNVKKSYADSNENEFDTILSTLESDRVQMKRHEEHSKKLLAIIEDLKTEYEGRIRSLESQNTALKNHLCLAVDAYLNPVDLNFSKKSDSVSQKSFNEMVQAEFNSFEKDVKLLANDFEAIVVSPHDFNTPKLRNIEEESLRHDSLLD